jgi:VWFA-related protein
VTLKIAQLSSLTLMFAVIALHGSALLQAQAVPPSPSIPNSTQPALPAAPANSPAQPQATRQPTPETGMPSTAATTAAQIAAAATGAAQTTATPAPSQEPNGSQIFVLPTVRVNLVNLVFTVTDKKGHFKRDLHRQDFGLLDNGLSPASVTSFTQQTDLPLRIGVMLDTSSSIRTRFKFEQDAATDFFLQIIRPSDRAFVEGFDASVQMAQNYTANIDLLNTGVHKLRPGGGTALYDALYTTCRDQMLGLRSNSDVRKVLIMVSDGDDNYSRAPESDAIKMCQRAETSVYTISTDNSPTRGKGGQVLSTIADATGGRAFFPDRLENVDNAFHTIEEELRSQYSLAYRPADFKQDGSFRTILLRAVDPRYHVRARTGYFAPKATP